MRGKLHHERRMVRRRRQHAAQLATSLPRGVYTENLVVNGEQRVFAVNHRKRVVAWRTVPIDDVDATATELWTDLDHRFPMPASVPSRRAIAQTILRLHLHS